MSNDNKTDAVSPFMVGVSGHRDLRPEDSARLRAQVSAILRQLAEHLPDSELRVVAGMATGADLLVAQTALELGFAVDALLPMPLEHYAADFDADSFGLLEDLLAHPHVRCRELPLRGPEPQTGNPLPDRDIHYALLTQHLVRGCSLLIALWDGEPSPLPGGTADTVLRYLGVRTDRNKEDERIEFSDAGADADLPARLVYWVPTARASSGADAAVTLNARAPCFLAGLGDNALQRLPALPRRLEVHLRSLNAYNREYQRFTGRWPVPSAPDSLRRDLPTALQIDDHDAPVLERIDMQYGKADALALHFQKRSDHLFAFFNLVAFAMGLAYLTYEKFMSTRLLLFAYLLILTSSVGVYYLLHERHWFAKHLMCRALAETLRVKFYLRLARCDQLVDAEEVLSLSGINRFHGFGWIGHVLIGVEAPAPYGNTPGSHAEFVDRAWIENQCRYFVRKVAKLHRSSVRTRWLKRALFSVIIAVVLILLLLGEKARQHLLVGIPLENVLTFLLGLMAVTLASWELHQNKMASRELLWQYRNQLKHFSRARAQLARTLAVGRRLEIIAALGKDSLMESYLWTIHRFHREHEPPGRA